MANDFSSIVDKIFARGLLALRENAVTPRLVNTDFAAEVAAQGDTINVPIPSAASVADVTPGPTAPAGGDSAPTTVPIQLNRWRKSDMFVTDKEAREIAEGARQVQLSEHLRVLANDVDAYLLSLYTGVYGFAGTAGSTPFSRGSNVYDLQEATEARKVLNKQLAPVDMRRMLLGPDAEGNALMVRAIQDASYRRQGEDTTSNGMIGSVLGFDWYMNQNIPSHTAGTITTGLAAKASTAVAAGATSFVATTAASTGACALKVGDVIAIAGQTQDTFVVTEAATQASAGADVTVKISPALDTALAGGEAVTVKADHVVNLGFHRDAFALAVRPLAPADGFTGGHEIRTAADPLSGLAITLEVSREYARTKYMWSILYGAKLVRPELACRIAG